MMIGSLKEGLFVGKSRWLLLLTDDDANKWGESFTTSQLFVGGVVIFCEEVFLFWITFEAMLLRRCNERRRRFGIRSKYFRGIEAFCFRFSDLWFIGNKQAYV